MEKRLNVNVSSWSYVDYGRELELVFPDGGIVLLKRVYAEIDRAGLGEDVVGEVDSEPGK